MIIKAFNQWFGCFSGSPKEIISCVSITRRLLYPAPLLSGKSGVRESPRERQNDRIPSWLPVAFIDHGLFYCTVLQNIFIYKGPAIWYNFFRFFLNQKEFKKSMQNLFFFFVEERRCRNGSQI